MAGGFSAENRTEDAGLSPFHRLRYRIAGDFWAHTLPFRLFVPSSRHLKPILFPKLPALAVDL